MSKKGKGLVPVLRRHLTTLLTIIAVILAISVGILLRQTTGPWTKRELMYLEFPGELFLRALKCLILPLIVSSLISSLGNLDATLSGKIGSRAVTYYILSTFCAIVLGIVLVSVIHPGHPSEATTGMSAPKTRVVTTEDTAMDLLRNVFPPNLIEACTAQYMTVLTPPLNSTNATNVLDWTISHSYGSGTNIIGLVAFSILLGIVLARLGPAGRPLLDLFNCLLEASMKITGMIIRATPIGVMFLVMPRIIEVEDVQAMLGSVGWYTITVIAGLVIHGFGVLPTFYFLVTRKNPFKFIGQVSAALMTAFGTSSSSAALPVTIDCLERNVKLDSRIVRFLVPIGATINMDGTALYEAVAAIFIAQSRGLDLSIIKLIIISVTSTAASVGAAGIPQAGLVTMVIVLNAVGLPAEDVALIFVVDWFLDRFRTMVNVLGDSFGSAIIQHLCRNELAEVVEANGLGHGSKLGPSEEGTLERSLVSDGERKLSSADSSVAEDSKIRC